MPQSTRLYTANRSSSVVVAQSSPGAIVPLLPALQTVLTTAETVIGDPGVPTLPLLCQIPPGGPLEQEEFQVVGSGWFNLGTSSTVTMKLYSGNSLTPGSNTLLLTSGAITAFAGKANWKFVARLIYDSNSGKLTGTVEFLINNVLVAAAVVTNVVTGINNVNNPVASFCFSVTYGTAGTQVINVKDFGVNH